MAIPINKYADISSTVFQTRVGSRDFSGLVFTTDTSLTTVSSYYSAVKAAYDAGKAVALSYTSIIDIFGANSKIAKFAAKYFSYSGRGGSPRVLNVAKYTAESEATAYANVISEFTNFGSFTFLGSDAADVASITPDNVVMVVAVDAGADYPTTFADNDYVHCVIGNPEDGVNYAAWMAMAWFASVNYDSDNAGGTIMYKRFAGETATITTGEAKDTADAAKMNYIGRVQAYGTMLQFYQNGVVMSGKDLGVIRDMMWVRSEVEAGWFNLANGANRIPANDTGAQAVYSMVVGVAMQGVSNGAILPNKTLSATKQAEVLQYSRDALNAVQTSGWYVSAQIVEEDDKHVCQYVLIYSKGDHIAKIEGQHVIV